ncbi:MAG: PAS domain S-box protein [Oscillospiraceae bacterium]|nr:PAS domain S-box protein [Oscillospiraceae bacterium]
MTNKIFRSTVFVAAIVLLCSLSIIMGALYDYFDDVQTAQLQDELKLAAIGTEESGLDFLQNVESSRFRLTWVAPDGSVIYDTLADASGMENHADREEIWEAHETGFGEAIRKSDTLLERTVYEAKRLNDGSVLRISVSQKTLMILVVGMLHPICLVALIAIILSAILANRMSKKIMEPLNDLDLEHPLENDTYEELSPLLNRIHQQHRQIDSQLRTLQRKTDEFQQITANMREGLVLLDSNRTVLSINPAAKELFGAETDCVGKDFCAVDRRQDMEILMEKAIRNGRCEAKIRREGREYQFVLSRIESGQKTVGLVILAIDVTELNNAERNRREFTANVSHELKTPLQSIIGSAELLENGLVKPEDTARFVGHIRKEASRLVLLVQDIIRLSHLDEGVEVPREDLDLMNIVQELTSSLQIAAEQKNVRICVTGEHCHIRGVRGLICEIIHNLCDNAIKYNVNGGRVDVNVKQMDGHVCLRVSDTGIGIPPEHQSRVFERFYRVDKSHSKQSGGTGLGLSIVKHAAQYHNARLNLQSTPGVGTTITVIF